VALLALTTICAAGQIETFAGMGTRGFSGDGGPAKQAQINDPFGLVRGPDGALYFCDTDNKRVRRIAADGTISTVAGSGAKGYTGDGGPALAAALNEPYEVRFDTAGNLYFVERLNHLVRRVDLKTGVISTVAGTGQPGFSGDGGPATKATFNQPHSIQFDRAGDLYICDILNHRIRKVEMKTGVISTFAGTGEKLPTPDGAPIAGTPLHGPRALDFDREGHLWLALREGNAVYEFDLQAGMIHHIAGTGKSGFSPDPQPAATAPLSGPKGLSIGPDGDIYLADTESHSVRVIRRKTGQIELIAGTGKKGDGPEGAPAACAMSRPHGVFVDRDGAIYIGDSEAHRILVVRP
jgi:streptogramin lyase